MATINLPIVFCGTYIGCDPIHLDLPFGLPSTDISDPCCKGIDQLMVDLGNLLAPIMPFLQLLDCVVKLTELVTLIPDAIGPPPSISKLASIGSKITAFIPCVNKLLELAPLPLPNNIIAFARFIRGLMQITIAILNCLKRMVTVSLQLSADIVALSLSDDAALREMGICLVEQNNQVGLDILSKINSLMNIFNLINAFLGIVLTAVPPLKSALESADPPLYPIVPTLSVTGPPTDFDSINSTIAILSAIEAFANIVAGGT